MDSFEAVVATVLRGEGYWVWPRFKVELTKAEKRKIGRPSSPRWELDVLAYKGQTNEVLVVECKSFINSPGVKANSFNSRSPSAKRYKLFNEPLLRRTVVSRLRQQLAAKGACPEDARVRLCLATGHIATERDRQELRAHFERKGWFLFDDHWLAEQLRSMKESAYEDDVAPVVAKLIDGGLGVSA